MEGRQAMEMSLFPTGAALDTSSWWPRVRALLGLRGWGKHPRNICQLCQQGRHQCSQAADSRGGSDTRTPSEAGTEQNSSGGQGQGQSQGWPLLEAPRRLPVNFPDTPGEETFTLGRNVEPQIWG